MDKRAVFVMGVEIIKVMSGYDIVAQFVLCHGLIKEDGIRLSCTTGKRCQLVEQCTGLDVVFFAIIVKGLGVFQTDILTLEYLFILRTGKESKGG
jgi:hypothetical protein